MVFRVASRGETAKCHLPVAIVIDNSASTKDIRELMNICSRKLIQSLKGSVLLADLVELLVIVYNSDAQILVDFKPLQQIGEDELDIKVSDGFTATGHALKIALAKLDQKKVEWKIKGEDYKQPLLFLITDGVPDAGKGAPKEAVEAVERTYAEAAREIRLREAEKKLVFIAAGIQRKRGERADMDRLRELSSHPERLLRINETMNGISGVERFFSLIYDATNVVACKNTSVDNVVGAFFHREFEFPVR